MNNETFCDMIGRVHHKTDFHQYAGCEKARKERYRSSEFKDPEECWTFCAEIHSLLKRALERKGQVIIDDPIDQQRLIHILEDYQYPLHKHMARGYYPKQIIMDDIIKEMK